MYIPNTTHSRNEFLLKWGKKIENEENRLKQNKNNIKKLHRNFKTK